MRKICVDLDGTIARYYKFNGPNKIGEPYPGAKEFIQALIDIGYEVIIFSCRNSPEYADDVNTGTLVIRNWLMLHDFPDCSIYCGSGKPIADWYIDDKGLRCEPDSGYQNLLEIIKKVK